MMNFNLPVRLAILASVILTVTSVCFAQKVSYNFMPGIDFSRFKTYKWVRIENAQYPNQLLDEQIMRSIDGQLAQKGLRKVDTGIPDLAVVYQAAVSQERQWNAYSTGGSYWGYGGWGGWGGMETTTATSTTIHVGTLNLDFYDIATKKQIWRGQATKTLDPPKDPAKLQGRIDRAMEKLLKNYPPPPK
jgi:Domain of unknown function (DUF4136)